MICTWYLAWIPLVIFKNCLKFHSPNGSWNFVWQFWNITRDIYAKYHYKSCYYLYLYLIWMKSFIRMKATDLTRTLLWWISWFPLLNLWTNLKVWPFKWKLVRCAFTWYCLFLHNFQSEFWSFSGGKRF